MSDDLRTRIMTALLSEDDVALMADAVIRELKLREERTESETVTNEQGATFHIQGGHRYVTEWTADE